MDKYGILLREKTGQGDHKLNSKTGLEGYCVPDREQWMCIVGLAS